MHARGTSALLVAALVSSGASAPFLHVHAHGPDHPGSSWGAPVDDHCAHHHAEGAHWHLPDGRTAAGDGAGTTVGDGHGHAAVALATSAIRASSAHVDAAPALTAAPETAVVSRVRGGNAPVAAAAGPDPPPRATLAARAPPVRT